MSAMKNFLMDQINELSASTNYSAEFLMDTWFENCGEMTWGEFKAATLEREWLEPNDPLADVVWMITVSPDCKKPVVRCAETGRPYPFAVTVMNKNFAGLPGLVAEARKKLNALRG